MFRQDFPLFAQHPDFVFLDSASSAQKPKIVIDRMTQFLQGEYANIHRGAYDLSMHASWLYDRAKQIVARFLDLDSHHGIVFTYNATYAVNILARSLVKSGILSAGDVVVLSEADHHANIVPWHILSEEYGITIRWVRVDETGCIDYESLAREIVGAKVLSITGASNVTGELLDLSRVQHILEALPEKPLWIVDGSQRFPHEATSIRTFWIDAYIATGHKIMADTGIGFIAGNREFLKKLTPAICGGGAINSVTRDGYEPAGLPFRHEPGTPHIVWAVSLLAALEYIDMIWGYEAIRQYEDELVAYAHERIVTLPEELTLIWPHAATRRIGVFSWTVSKYHPHDIAEMLADHGIAVRSGHHCAEPLHHALSAGASLRASLYIYNTRADIDRLCDVLTEIFYSV